MLFRLITSIIITVLSFTAYLMIRHTRKQDEKNQNEVVMA